MRGYTITAIIKNIAGVSIKLKSDENETLDFLITEAGFKEFDFDEGDTVTEEDVAALEAEANFCRAAARCLKILSYSSHSKMALARKLCQFGFDKETAKRAAEDAEEKGHLNEKRQADHLVDYYLRHKYWGKKRIAAELMSRGYGKDAIMSAIESADEDRFANNLARLVASKAVPEEKSERDKYIAALSRMGYSLPEILKAIEK
jgi:SOS response regulatory protein OraA/RecX